MLEGKETMLSKKASAFGAIRPCQNPASIEVVTIQRNIPHHAPDALVVEHFPHEIIAHFFPRGHPGDQQMIVMPPSRHTMKFQFGKIGKGVYKRIARSCFPGIDFINAVEHFRAQGALHSPRQ